MRWPLILALCAVALPLGAAQWDVPARPGAIADYLDRAAPGDTLRLAPGIHDGPVSLDRPLVLDGGGAATLDGGGTGSVITVTAPDVTVRGLTIIGSGSDHQGIDSGIRLLKGADRAVIEQNRLTGNLYGVDIHGALDARVAANRIDGRQDRRMNDRGNGIYVWNAPGAVVEGNDVRWGRDGIFVNSSKRNIFRDNRFRDLRFAVHYMYANQSEVTGNISIGNDLGYAVMFSKRVKVANNLSVDDREHGIMLNYANHSEITGNIVVNGANRCAFLYNANRNRFAGNRFEGCEIGIHFTAGSQDNAITGNAFVGNRTQVKYVSTKWAEWSEDGRGNYWSDFAAYDLDGDGIADVPYRPNDAMDHVLWTQPAAKLLLGSPAVQLVRWSQSAFPALLPGGVTDGAPLMRPEPVTPPVWPEEEDAHG
ncbi:nitrous oxide reductase family maturation protein NosD [Pukyongiella litopenaei]|uniref:Nitrous oxide reductase family maturation protein NosD n=1 Tax=Pukyongiella litopenaei TaxID=2605946 RepID=A0A2S0MRW0_9RHOB|nr:nitrous oxide reductase family maturation protein NosD [Pukyongiella litopenaei]AVO38614.1 nitrous oxide reductase family maturation protein NosD [Pukyongiella litopenaei]